MVDRFAADVTDLIRTGDLLRLDPAAGTVRPKSWAGKGISIDRPISEISAGPHVFGARLERERGGAADLRAKFLSLLPYRERIIHVRWSGEACWIPLGALDLGLPLENGTSYPRARPDPALSRWGQRDRDIARLRRGSIRQQARPARRQPFPDDHRRARQSPSARRADPMARRAGHPIWTGMQFDIPGAPQDGSPNTSSGSLEATHGVKAERDERARAGGGKCL